MNQVSPYVERSVLDVGCGNAGIVALARDRIKSYCGIERNAKFLDELKGKLPKRRFYQLDMDNDQLDFEGEFDTVLLIAVLEHIYNRKHLFTQILKKLKPAGKIVITTPTIFGDFIHRIGAKLGFFAESAVHGHIIIYSKPWFRVLAKNFGLRIHKYKTFEFGCNQLVILTRQ
jgi:SAM-dependent methyltransferase